MIQAEQRTHPHRPFFASRYITLGEAVWLLGKELEAASAPCPRADGDGPQTPRGDTLLRIFLGQPSLVQAWAARADGDGAAVDHPYGA